MRRTVAHIDANWDCNFGGSSVTYIPVTTLLAASLLASDEIDARHVDAGVAALAIRARSGDRHAQRAIYDRNAPRIHRFVVDLLRDRDSARDAVQDTFIRVFQGLHALEDPARLVGWIFGIARRVCLEHKRALTRRRQDAAPPEHAELLAHNGPSPEKALADAESAAMLEQALDKLSADRRTLLLLRCDHMLSYEEIATAMGFSLAKVKVEIHRARGLLRAALEAEVR